METEEVVVASRRADAFGAANVHDAVAGDAVGGDLGGLEWFAAEGLDGVAPQGADGEGHVGIVSKRHRAAVRAAARGSSVSNTAHCTSAPSSRTPIAAGTQSGTLG